MIFLILKQQCHLNKINSEIKTTFAAYLTSMKLKNHLFQHIRELDEIFGLGVQPLKRYTFYVVAHFFYRCATTLSVTCSTGASFQIFLEAGNCPSSHFLGGAKYF